MTEYYRLYHIAKLYYVDGYKQSEIAKMMALSTMAVSRMLKRAEEEGIVTITVQAPAHINLELGSRLRQKYSTLREAIVVYDDPNRDTREAVGEAAAQYVMDLLVPDCIMGISWGKAIYEFSRMLKPQNMSGIKVIQLTGGFLYSSDYLMMPSNLVKLASERLRANSLFLNAPMFVASEEVGRQLMADSMNQYVMSMVKKSLVNVVGLSALLPSATISKVGIITEEDRQELLEKGAIGDVAGFFVDKAGTPVEWSRRGLCMGASLQDIAAAPHVVCLAVEPQKAEITHISLRRGYINTLVISESLANAMLSLS